MKNYTAKSLDELLKTVAQEKACSVEELTYFITEEKAGFLGFGSSVSADVYAPSDVEEFIELYLTKFFENIQLSVVMDIHRQGNQYKVDLNAENNAVIIGKAGQSLRGLSQVLRSAVNSEFKHRFFVTIDVNSYYQERYTKVRAMAKRIAKNVLRSKIDVTLDPMPSDERKVIHQTLQEYANLKTESTGEGMGRRLTIKYIGE